MVENLLLHIEINSIEYSQLRLVILNQETGEEIMHHYGGNKNVMWT